MMVPTNPDMSPGISTPPKFQHRRIFARPVILPVVLVHVILSSLRMCVVILAPHDRFPPIKQKTEISAHQPTFRKNILKKDSDKKKYKDRD